MVCIVFNGHKEWLKAENLKNTDAKLYQLNEKQKMRIFMEIRLKRSVICIC